MDKVLHRCIFYAFWEFAMCPKTCQKPLSTYGIIGIVSTLLFQLLMPKQIPNNKYIDSTFLCNRRRVTTSPLDFTFSNSHAAN
jgi:hypothetical protein